MSGPELRYKTLADLSRILSLFEVEGVSELGVSEIARGLDVLSSKISRMLKTLDHEGLLERDPCSRKYRIGPRFFVLGLTRLFDHPLRPIILPHLEQMARESGLEASWAAGPAVGGQIAVADRLLPSIRHIVGEMLPLYASSCGRVLLAYMSEEDRNESLSHAKLESHTEKTVTDLTKLRRLLDQIKHDGFAVDLGEVFPVLSAVSAPVFDKVGSVVAIVQVSKENAPREFATPEVADYLTEKACFISRQLGWKSDSPIGRSAEA